MVPEKHLSIDKRPSIDRIRRYIPEQVVEKLMNETQKTPAPVVVSDSLQLADTLVVKTDSSLVQKTDTLKTAAKKEEKTPVASTEKGNLSRYG
mgnify:CR=1 FL=1